MPIKIQSDLPAKNILDNENIFVMDEYRALHQDIRPLQIIILNLMPVKEETELQLLRALSNTPLQVDVTFMKMNSHVSLNTSSTHLNKFYNTFNELKEKKWDGLIITGAPVEQMEFEEVDYWNELCEIMEWSKFNVTSTFHICWGAQAGLYYHFGLNKVLLDEKMLVVMAESEEAGVLLVMTQDGKQVFVMGHPEYDRYTLKNEYFRDKEKGLPISPPKNYFPQDDDTKRPYLQWRSHCNNLYTNWLNYYVYQATPYEI